MLLEHDQISKRQISIFQLNASKTDYGCPFSIFLSDSTQKRMYVIRYQQLKHQIKFQSQEHDLFT